MSIEKINAGLLNLPPAWIQRAVERGGGMANAQEIKKLLGEPIPQVVDPSTLAPHIAKFFRRGGLLERIRKKLSLFTRKKGGKFLPARNTIASVDEFENLYVGVDFLEKNGHDEELVAGIISHEWGHMKSDLPKGMNWAHLTWDELLALRREEEANADGFAGRAMFLLNLSVEPLIGFLKRTERRRKDKEKLPCHKYHNLATRAAILRGSYEAQRHAMETARRLFSSSKLGLKVGRVIGEG